MQVCSSQNFWPTLPIWGKKHIMKVTWNLEVWVLVTTQTLPFFVGQDSSDTTLKDLYMRQSVRDIVSISKDDFPELTREVKSILPRKQNSEHQSTPIDETDTSIVASVTPATPSTVTTSVSTPKAILRASNNQGQSKNVTASISTPTESGQGNNITSQGTVSNHPIQGSPNGTVNVQPSGQATSNVPDSSQSNQPYLNNHIPSPAPTRQVNSVSTSSSMSHLALYLPGLQPLSQSTPQQSILVQQPSLLQPLSTDLSRSLSSTARSLSSLPQIPGASQLLSQGLYAQNQNSSTAFSPTKASSTISNPPRKPGSGTTAGNGTGTFGGTFPMNFTGGSSYLTPSAVRQSTNIGNNGSNTNLNYGLHASPSRNSTNGLSRPSDPSNFANRMVQPLSY
eukprot:TRINITY_DN291_c0_g1_i3.p1 TRINITY_DN291_c0_g1~~TRINITY_DN291_c0_g1_i3.p1  ORF type:complete len:394 (-),score=45.64 TRINITY_DN291_c0_g1_i3:485-1666(-)